VGGWVGGGGGAEEGIVHDKLRPWRAHFLGFPDFLGDLFSTG
jgi:hypothetical protein